MYFSLWSAYREYLLLSNKWTLSFTDKNINTKPYWRLSVSQQLRSHTNYSVFPSFQKDLGASTEAVFSSCNLLCVTEKFPDGIIHLRTLRLEIRLHRCCLQGSKKKNTMATPVSGLLSRPWIGFKNPCACTSQTSCRIVCQCACFFPKGFFSQMRFLFPTNRYCF